MRNLEDIQEQGSLLRDTTFKEEEMVMKNGGQTPIYTINRQSKI